MKHLQETEVVLPDGARLTAERFLGLGLGLGMNGKFSGERPVSIFSK